MNKQAVNDSLLLSPKILVEVAVEVLAIWAVALSCWRTDIFKKWCGSLSSYTSLNLNNKLKLLASVKITNLYFIQVVLIIFEAENICFML
jgi:hypothetical protein